MKKNKFKINNNGFTLIELLVTIFLIGIVVTLSVVTISTGIKKSKEKSLKVAKNSLLSSGNNYVKETYTEKNWVKDESNKVLFTCVNVDQLISKGYLDKDFKTKNEKLKDINFIYYKKNNETNTIIERSFVEDETENDVFCKGLVVQDVVPAPPKFIDSIKDSENKNEQEGNEGEDNNSVPNKPDLSTGLVPIKYDETKSKWVVTSESDSEWYDYDKQKWANAASLKSTVLKTPGTELDIENDVYAMFVWIPRFSYMIGCAPACLGYKVESDTTSWMQATPGAIDIKFVSTDDTKEMYQNSGESVDIPRYDYDSSDTELQRIAKRDAAENWYTHPAFTFGYKELSGIWVGKFETSAAEGTTCYDSSIVNCSLGSEDIRILPNVTSLRNQNVKTQFYTAQIFSKTGNVYSLTGDSHMMKNSEWGAVVYLSQSIYGKYGNSSYKDKDKKIYMNNSKSYYTGRSAGAVQVFSANANGNYKYDGTPTSGGTKDVLKGTGASTTGNIYGIYDMSGGTLEYVMGNFYNDLSQKQDPGNSGFTSAWFTSKTKYFDKYPYLGLMTTYDQYTNGGALSETRKWYDCNAGNLGSNTTWLVRGGEYLSSGCVFSSSSKDGSNRSDSSFRVILVSNK